jgi:hypothetical protein
VQARLLGMSFHNLQERRHVVSYVGVNVSEEHSAFIFSLPTGSILMFSLPPWSFTAPSQQHAAFLATRQAPGNIRHFSTLTKHEYITRFLFTWHPSQLHTQPILTFYTSLPKHQVTCPRMTSILATYPTHPNLLHFAAHISDNLPSHDIHPSYIPNPY